MVHHHRLKGVPRFVSPRALARSRKLTLSIFSITNISPYAVWELKVNARIVVLSIISYRCTAISIYVCVCVTDKNRQIFYLMNKYIGGGQKNHFSQGEVSFWFLCTETCPCILKNFRVAVGTLKSLHCPVWEISWIIAECINMHRREDVSDERQQWLFRVLPFEYYERKIQTNDPKCQTEIKTDGDKGYN